MNTAMVHRLQRKPMSRGDVKAQRAAEAATA